MSSIFLSDFGINKAEQPARHQFLILYTFINLSQVRRMKRIFPHIIQNLTSPEVSHQKLKTMSWMAKFMHKRKVLKDCKELWPEFTKKNVQVESANLYFRLKKSIKQSDEVEILKTCSIPLFQKFKRTIKDGGQDAITVLNDSFYEEIYNIEIDYLERVQKKEVEIQGNQQQQIIGKQIEWIRVFVKFRHYENSKIFIQTHCLQRKIETEETYSPRKWYLSALDI